MTNSTVLIPKARLPRFSMCPKNRPLSRRCHWDLAIRYRTPCSYCRQSSLVGGFSRRGKIACCIASHRIYRSSDDRFCSGNPPSDCRCFRSTRGTEFTSCLVPGCDDRVARECKFSRSTICTRCTSLLFYYSIHGLAWLHPSHVLRQLILMTDLKCAQIFEQVATVNTQEESQSLLLMLSISLVRFAV